jgi:hypothetical protein
MEAEISELLVELESPVDQCVDLQTAPGKSTDRESIRVFMTRNILDSSQEETLKGMSRFLSLPQWRQFQIWM